MTNLNQRTGSVTIVEAVGDVLSATLLVLSGALALVTLATI